MAQQSRRSDDFPDFDTFPGPESPHTPQSGRDYVPTTLRQGIGAEGPVPGPPPTGSQVPGTVNRPAQPMLPATASVENARLNSAAQQIGGAIGRSVATARNLPNRAREAGAGVRQRLQVIRDAGGGAPKRRLADRASEFKDRARDRALEIRDNARQRLEHAQERASEAAARVRERVSRVPEERPLETLLAVFAASFLAGTALRIWRSSRD